MDTLTRRSGHVEVRIVQIPKLIVQVPSQSSARGTFVGRNAAGVLSIGLLFGLGESGGEDALTYIWPDVIAATVVWLVGLAAMLLLFSEPTSRYYQLRTAPRAARPANGTGR